MASNIQIWLSKGSDRFQFPVNPESFSVDNSMSFDDIDIVQFGEITRFGNAKQREISFSCFFPRDYHPSYCSYLNIPRPYDAVNKLLNWMNAKQEVQLVIVGSNVNMAVTIRSFEYSEEGGLPGDIKFDITLKEYRKINPRVYDPNAVINRPGTPTASSKYTVLKGDTLLKIAQKLLGSSSKWKTIYDANKALIGSNPNRIYAGQVLTIPGSTATTPTTAGGTFTIRSGDTLYEIAAAYTNTTVSTLLSLNPGIKVTSLKVGAVIKLPSNAVKLRDPKRIGVSSSASTSSATVLTTPASPSTVALTQWQTEQRASSTNPTDFFPTNG